MAELIDPGMVIAVPDEVLDAPSPVRAGSQISADITVKFAARSGSLGVRHSNTDIVADNNEITLPGYALQKGLRVLTLVNDSRVAVSNIIQ